MTRPENVLDFWFGEPDDDPDRFTVDLARWFEPDTKFDRIIAEKFGAAIGQAASDELTGWKDTTRGRLALIILLDQFPRNVFRGTGKAFAFDERAVQLCVEGLDARADRELSTVERLFFYLPLLHSECSLHQKRSVACFWRLAAEGGPLSAELRKWVRLARAHRFIIAIFGRFPHRNAAVRRRTTRSERLFLFSCRLRTWLGDKVASAYNRRS